MSADQKKQLQSLVRARESISNKFRKLRRNKIIKEKEFKEKYSPITNTIKQLIDKKVEIPKKKDDIDREIDLKKNSPINDSKNVSNEEVDDNISIDFENEREEVPKSENNVNKKNNTFQQPRNVLFSSDIFNVANLRKNERQKSQDRRKKNRSSKSDDPRSFNLDNVDDELHVANEDNDSINIPKQSHLNTDGSIKMFETTHSDNESITTFEPSYSIDDHNAQISEQTNQNPIKYLTVEDYEKLYSTGKNYTGAIKSVPSKVNRIKKSPYDRKHSIKVKDFDELSDKGKNKQIKYNKNEDKVIISPEDFDHEGFFVGSVKPKRRMISTSIKKLELAYRKKKRSGKCLEKKFIPYSENIVYEYYDNPNDLCERLKLLLSSKSAGNTNHNQEINSIIHELRHRHIIE